MQQFTAKNRPLTESNIPAMCQQTFRYSNTKKTEKKGRNKKIQTREKEETNKETKKKQRKNKETHLLCCGVSKV